MICTIPTNSKIQDTRCQIICNFNYAPVCGKASDGSMRTFSNECELNSENCIYKTGKFLRKIYLK